MENNQSYFGGIANGLKTLATGLKVTFKEYLTPKSTEQYPENRKTTLHVAKRHRGRLVFKRNEDGSHKCVACTMCEKACPNGTIKTLSEMVTNEEGKKKRQLVDYHASCVRMLATSTPLSLRMILRTAYSSVVPWFST